MLLVVSIFVLMVTCDTRCVRKVKPHTAVTPKLQPPTKNKIPTPSPTSLTSGEPTPDSRTQSQPTPSPDTKTPGQPTPILRQPTPGPPTGETIIPTTSPTASIELTPTPSPTAAIELTPTPSPTAAIELTPTPSPVGATNAQPTPAPIEQNEIQQTSRIQFAIQPMGIDHQVQEANSLLLNASMEKSMQRSIRSTNGLHPPERYANEKDEEVYCNDYNAATILNTKCTIVIICFATIALLDL